MIFYAILVSQSLCVVFMTRSDGNALYNWLSVYASTVLGAALGLVLGDRFGAGEPPQDEMDICCRCWWGFFMSALLGYFFYNFASQSPYFNGLASGIFAAMLWYHIVWLMVGL